MVFHILNDNIFDALRYLNIKKFYEQKILSLSFMEVFKWKNV